MKNETARVVWWSSLTLIRIGYLKQYNKIYSFNNDLARNHCFYLKYGCLVDLMSDYYYFIFNNSEVFF